MVFLWMQLTGVLKYLSLEFLKSVLPLPLSIRKKLGFVGKNSYDDYVQSDKMVKNNYFPSFHVN